MLQYGTNAGKRRKPTLGQFVELMGVYLWNVHVCSALYPLIAAVEISLRNTIDQALVAAHQAGLILAHVRRMVATLRDFRNRLFHHEPAWKRYGVLTEADANLARRKVC